MNTVGKTLVVLNFLFAVVVGAFLVVDFATRTSWKNEYEKLKGQMQVVSAERQQWADDSSKQRGNTKTQAMENDKLKDQMAMDDAKHKAELAGYEAKLTEKDIKLKDADITLQKTLSDLQRSLASEATQKGVIADREKTILALQDENKKLRTEAISYQNVANQVQERNKELLDQVQKLGNKVARQKAAVSTSAEGTRIDARYNDANPPNTMVKGKIEKINPEDSTLVQLSVGTDHGVNKNNTMEVFRTSPAPKYLGMVRIVDASPHHSVGRLIVPPGVSRPQLQVGDMVWSRLR
jgi:hypothetical protein